MANLKSSKKDILRNTRNRSRNVTIKSKVKTFYSKIGSLMIQGGTFEDIMKAIITYESIAMKAVSKGILVKKSISKKVSHITQKAKIEFAQNARK